MKTISLGLLILIVVFGMYTGCSDFPFQGPNDNDSPEPLTLANQQSIASDFIIAFAYILSLDPTPTGITIVGEPKVATFSNYELPTSYDTENPPTPEFIGSGSVFNGTVTINEESATTTVYTVNLTVVLSPLSRQLV